MGERTGRPGPDPREHPHGTRNRYQAGCKCPPCREANALWTHLWRHTRTTTGAPTRNPTGRRR